MIIIHILGCIVNLILAGNGIISDASSINTTKYFQSTAVPYSNKTDLWDFKNDHTEEYAKAGNEIHLDCGRYRQFEVSYQWKSSQAEIQESDRYAFKENFRVLHIKDLKYTDRKEFQCIVTSDANSTITKSITLRVKDPLGALWPFLGIVVEAVVLALTIICFGKCKRNCRISSY